MDSLSELIRRIQHEFRDGPPNGWLLNWPLVRFKELRLVVAPHELENWTSFDYSFCNRFEVRIPNKGKSFYLLTILTSYVANFYSLHWTFYKDGKKGKVVSVDDSALIDLASRVREFLISQGMRELPLEWDLAEVPGVELELAGCDNVTVGKCLFDDSDAY